MNTPLFTVMLRPYIWYVCFFISILLLLTFVYQYRYQKWCKSNNFNSMLPEDAKSCKRVATDKARQSSVTEHFGPKDPTSKPTPYSHKAFEAATFEWLIETNQVRLSHTISLSSPHTNMHGLYVLADSGHQ